MKSIIKRAVIKDCYVYGLDMLIIKRRIGLRVEVIFILFFIVE